MLLVSNDFKPAPLPASACPPSPLPPKVDARSGRVSELISARATQKNHVHLAAPGDDGASPLLVQAVLNPLSQGAQRLAPLLSFLRSVLGAEVDLLLNPQRDHESLPLKTFYRYVLPALDGEGLPQPAAASFAGLPPDKVLTLGMDEPEPW
jgi:UDP-glucose:glycoprotein glucosyltransferase